MLTHCLELLDKNRRVQVNGGKGEEKAVDHKVHTATAID